MESLIAVAIFGIGVSGAIAALATGALSVNVVDQDATAQSLAVSQMSYTKSYPYDPVPSSYPTADIYNATYNPHPISMPSGYAIAVSASAVPGANDDLQKITVTVSRDSDTVLTLEDLKVNR